MDSRQTADRGVLRANPRVTFLVSAILIAALAPTTAAGPKDCTTVRGTLLGHATGPNSFESVLTGDLAGTLLGTNFEILAADQDGTLHGVVDHEFISADGTFNTFADVVLSPIGSNVYRTSERNFFLPGGTGVFEDATGRLAIHAVFDFNTGEGSGRYHGRICTGTHTPAVESNFTTIDVPGATTTVALDINSAGVIVGRYTSAADGNTHGFMRSKHGALTTIDFPGAVFTVAAGINGGGDIVGMYRLPTDGSRVRHAFLLTDGEFTTIDPPGAAFTNALGINSAGQIVGRFCTTVAILCMPDTGNVHGFLFSGGEFTTIDVPGAVRTNAWKIDPAGNVVGGYTAVDGKNHIFVLEGGRFTTVALPPTAGIPLENGGITARGDIAATYCETAPCTATSRAHGFVLSRRAFTSIDFPDAVSTAVFSINSRGDLVGFYDDADGKRHGFLLRDKE